jgi:sortase B
MRKNQTGLKAFCGLAIVLLLGVAVYSGWQVFKTLAGYRAEADLRDAVMEYKPAPDETVNQGVLDLQATYPDVAGWLTVPGTKIDYPFVWRENNDFYLRRDLNGKHAAAGTLFLDYRCKKDLTSNNTIIYGHNMKNDSMFGTLKLFDDKAFFDENKYGVLYLPHKTLTLEFFAYMVIKHTNQEIYRVELGEGYLDYVKQNARLYRDVALADGDRIVTLSTCSYEFNNARMVLLARVG